MSVVLHFFNGTTKEYPRAEAANLHDPLFTGSIARPTGSLCTLRSRGHPRCTTQHWVPAGGQPCPGQDFAPAGSQRRFPS